MLNPHSAVVPLFGSSFPVWLFAAGMGIIVALFVRQALILTGLARDLPWPALFHPALALLFAVMIYTLWIGGYS